METEKLLPVGEPGIEIDALPVTRMPSEPATPTPSLPGVPSPAQQQWGVVISIVIIVMMIITGAFYAWGQRIAQNEALIDSVTAQ